MRSAVGIRFESCGKVYNFGAGQMDLKQGECVVVESEMGVSIGKVVVAPHEIKDEGKDLKPVLRRVTDEDRQKEIGNKDLKDEAFVFCNERIMARGLEMKLLGTDVTLDRRRIVFYFSADTRIDFRELVKDLAAKFRTRIELRQIGVRDAAKVAGGLGICGRELCCRKFLTSFAPISIKMAKQQDLSLNTSKLSGLCGRLMCCLGYEYVKGPKVTKPSAKKEAVIKPAPDAIDAAPAEAAAAPAPQAAPPEPERRQHRKRRHGRRSRAGKSATGSATDTQAKGATGTQAEGATGTQAKGATDTQAKGAADTQAKGAATAETTKKPRRRRRSRRRRKPKSES